MRLRSFSLLGLVCVLLASEAKVGWAQSYPNRGECDALMAAGISYLGTFEESLNYMGRRDISDVSSQEELSVKLAYNKLSLQDLFDANAKIQSDLDPNRLDISDHPRFDSVSVYLRNVYFFFQEGVEFRFSEFRPEWNDGDNCSSLSVIFNRSIVGKHAGTGVAVNNSRSRVANFEVRRADQGWDLSAVSVVFEGYGGVPIAGDPPEISDPVSLGPVIDPPIVVVPPRSPIDVSVEAGPNGLIRIIESYREGDTFFVRYDLVGDKNEYDVEILLSTDGRENFEDISTLVQGDIGTVRLGPDKNVTWAVLDIFPAGLSGDANVLQVIALEPPSGSGFWRSPLVITTVGALVGAGIFALTRPRSEGVSSSSFPMPPIRPGN